MKAERSSETRLWIEIDEKDVSTFLGKSMGQVQGSRGLTHATFLVGDGDDVRHLQVVDRSGGNTLIVGYLRNMSKKLKPALHFVQELGHNPRRAKGAQWHR